jgi:hypothetical protein
MISFVQCAAYLQTLYETVRWYWHFVRKEYLLPIVQRGGKDMILMKNGHWVDADTKMHDDQIDWAYNSTEHRLSYLADESVRHIPWPWLSVIHTDMDMSDFFAELRVTAGRMIPKEQALMLYVHQKGWSPHGSLQITKRDLEEQELDISGAFPPGKKELIQKTLQESISEIDFIR